MAGCGMSFNAVSRIQLRRPLVGIAIGFVTGTGLAACWPLPLGFLFFMALFFLLLSLLFLKTGVSTWCLLLCCACLAACHYTVSASGLSERLIQRRYAERPAGPVHVDGRIAATPEFYPYPSGGRGAWVFPLACEGEKTANGWEQLHGRIWVRVSEGSRADHYEYGERWCFSGRLKQRNNPFVREKWTLAVSPHDSRERLSSPRFSLISWGLHLRRAASATLTRGLENFPNHLSILKALLIGDRESIPHETYEKFTRTGTLHIFAISGLHVGMVGVLIVSVFKTAGIARKFWGIWLLPLLLFYVLASGMKPSAFRPLTMAALYFLAPLFG
ncbi:MAG: ComEC/Rec2 family competence protein, partial [Kiritimatiellales bacterium]|nr:ComEC/Rec2 family competence protein [Kiritimatiellales bacterium]